MAGVGGYVGWTVVMIVLTIVAFVAVGYGLLPAPWLVALLLVLAAIQVAAQVLLFMHLSASRRFYGLAFGAGLGFAVIFAVGLMYLVWAY
ncbi:MAG: cytochrome C oxidase subunit IV family protein [Clostridia bacterium]|nr:cytochrome C oxidase subunit IV family protein [Clostridia bacterium]